MNLARIRLRNVAISVLAAIAWFAGGVQLPAATAASDAITVSGTILQRGGIAWVPKGVQIVGLLPGFPVPHQHWGATEVQRLKAFGADLIRFQVAQPALARGDQSYLTEVRDAVGLARSNGLNVILSIQDESPSGESNPLGMPTAATGRAWATLTPLLKSDLGVMGELFNEPQPQPNATNWRIWANGGAFGGGTAIGHQQLIIQLRNAGVHNVLIAEGLALGKSFASNPPTLNDPQHQLAFGTHPYFGPVNGVPDNNPTAWDANFGNYAKTHTVLATEWDENSFGPPSCTAQIPAQATNLVNSYLPSHHIGLAGFAFDVINTLIKDWNYTLTTYTGFTCGQPGFGPGQLIHNHYTASAAALTVAATGFTVQSRRNNLCLDADIDSHGGTNPVDRNGMHVQLWSCNGRPNQRWLHDGNPGRIRNVRNNLCLDADISHGLKDGIKLQLWTCNGWSNQGWADQGGELESEADLSKCADADIDPHGGTNPVDRNGMRVQLWGCGSPRPSNQLWNWNL